MNKRDKAGFKAIRKVENAHCEKHNKQDVSCSDCMGVMYVAINENFPALIGIQPDDAT